MEDSAFNSSSVNKSIMNRQIDFAFLDSGTGGIPYMLNLKSKKPELRCVYLGDTANFPYGEKSTEEIIQAASDSVRKIVDLWHPRSIIVACNTISVTALEDLRKLFPEMPVVGTVPAIRLASRTSRNRNIGLLATNATVNHPYNRHLIENYASDCKVFSRGDPDLISFIEHDLFTSTQEERLEAVKPAVDFFKENNCDVIILGCTHFTHIANEISLAAGDSVQVVDSRDGVSNQALRVEEMLGEPKENSFKCDVPDECFFVTGLGGEDDEREYATLCRNFNIPWGGKI